jgi:hypothetical protein
MYGISEVKTPDGQMKQWTIAIVHQHGLRIRMGGTSLLIKEAAYDGDQQRLTNADILGIKSHIRIKR